MSLILVIDDDPAMRDILRTILQSVKFQVIEAANGVAGLSLFRERKPNLVITDILMPEKDGIETLREMRKIDANALIIAMSGGGPRKIQELP